MMFILKICRKARHIFHRFYTRGRFWFYRSISGGRHHIPAASIAGDHFRIRYDLSQSFIAVSSGLMVRDNFTIHMGHGGKLNIGDNNFFNNYCSINCFGEISIGSNNQFGESVFLYDHNHVYQHKDKLIGEQGYKTGSIKIGNNCWIGSHVIILKDVEIGDNVVIGAGCVIHKSIPAGSLVINNQQLSVSNIHTL